MEFSSDPAPQISFEGKTSGLAEEQSRCDSGVPHPPAQPDTLWLHGSGGLADMIP